MRILQRTSLMDFDGVIAWCTMVGAVWLIAVTQRMFIAADSVVVPGTQQQQQQQQQLRVQQSVVITPDLPLGDINILVVTDTHSWCGGQKKLYGEDVAANYGDVLSFVQRLKQYIDESDEEREIWFVMNGDFIDGTGLSMNRNVDALIPILERMQYDAINVGNHELYTDHLIEQMSSPAGLIEWYGEKYISTNVRFNTSITASTGSEVPLQPIGNSYYMLKGKHYNVLTFGFLYNMPYYASSVMVVKVEDVVQESWFIDIVQKMEDYDAILVLAHMHVRDPLCQIIVDAIRTITGNVQMPVQFITGHTHIRDYEILDPWSTSFEAGHFLDTLGFVSFPTMPTVLNQDNTPRNESTMTETTNNMTNSSIAPLFKYKYIDTNVNIFASTLGLSLETFSTKDGMEQSHFIKRIQEELGLNEVIGCIDDTYYLNRTVDAHDSLWRLFRDVVVPSRFIDQEVLFLGSGGWRFDLYSGTVSVDDVYGISPFNNTFWAWNNIPVQVIRSLNITLNALPSQFPTSLPNFVIAPAQSSFYSKSNGNYTLIVDSYSVDMIEDALREIIIPEYGSTIPVREELSSELTTTTVWMDYFQQHSHVCQNVKQTTPTKHKSSKPSSTHNDGNEYVGDDSSSDTVRMLFVAVSVVTMIALSSVIVHQKRTIFQFIMERRDRATMEAIREYEERDDNYDADDVSEEGEFT